MHYQPQSAIYSLVSRCLHYSAITSERFRLGLSSSPPAAPLSLPKIKPLPEVPCDGTLRYATLPVDDITFFADFAPALNAHLPDFKNIGKHSKIPMYCMTAEMIKLNTGRSLLRQAVCHKLARWRDLDLRPDKSEKGYPCDLIRNCSAGSEGQDHEWLQGW